MRLIPFDIVVVPFPYADRLAEKRRPAVVISAPGVSARYRLVWLAMITSAANPRWDCDVDISDLNAAALPAPSRIRPVKIATADVGRVIRRIGHLGAADAKMLKNKLDGLLAKLKVTQNFVARPA
jgi:mRNA interferase MazF